MRDVVVFVGGVDDSKVPVVIGEMAVRKCTSCRFDECAVDTFGDGVRLWVMRGDCRLGDS